MPAGTNTGAVHLQIAPAVGGGKSQISHRKDDLTGHGPGSAFGPGFTAEYSWMGDGTVSVTASLKFGIKTADYGITPGPSPRTGENVWDKVLIYEPGNLNGGTSDSLWHTETVDYTTGKWWFFDRTVGASTIGMPLTLSDMSTSAFAFSGAKTIADVYALITAPGAIITSVQFGIGSGNAGGSVYVNQLETSAYRAGMTTTFGCGDFWYSNGFETDDFGWNVFGSAGFASTRVASGTNGITSATGAWHEETTVTAAGNWGGYSGVCGCASGSCSASSVFPTGGYVTSIDMYLDLLNGSADDSRFEFDSAINDAAGVFRRDFIFNGTFLHAANPAIGTGVDRFVFAASNNSIGDPKNGVDPYVITSSGWFTFEHHFYDGGGGVLACDFVILDSSGTELVRWTRSDPSDLIGTTVGGNRYAWFTSNQLGYIAFDNAERRPGPYDQDITPDVIFGSGNTNGSFTVDRQDGVELGMRGKLRNPPTNQYNSNGDGTYTFNTGPGSASLPQSEWSFEWAVNTDFDDSSGLLVGDLTYEMGMDNDPGAGTDYLVFDPISIGTIIPYAPPSPPIPYWDHAMGDNTTPNGGGVSAGDGTTYATYLSTYIIAQNSWKPTFYQNTAPYVWDATTPGQYEYYLAAFSGSTEVARTAITIFAVDGATLSLEGDPCQTDQDAGTAGVQISMDLWFRNPDDEEITGYQTFLEFSTLDLTFEPTLSSYTPSPFGFHIQPMLTAEVSAGELRLDGNTFSPTGTTGDEKLATLVFTVAAECTPVSVGFDLTQAFDSEVSYLGLPITTDLLDSPLIVPDDTDPVIATNPDITQASDAGACTGAVVTWTDPSATDNCDVSVDVVCSPPSGSFFPVGATVVTCTATDDCGNTDTSTFTVTVTATVLVDVVVTLPGSVATSRCIEFIPDCGASTSIVLPFVLSGPATATATIELPCGVYSKLCAKDEQHTQYDDTTLSIVGSKYVADTTLVLKGGDTDDDGDVDINDVTLLLAQYGLPAVPGGCPWGGLGVRDADFSNNGVVGAEDYSFFSSVWLTTSGCVCPLVYGGGDNVRGRLMRSVRVHNAQTSAADYNGDGHVDVRDVEMFEDMYGFSGRELSKRMKSMR